ncbi:hypothetical protein [Mucilaginibacter pedocola]|uniref:Uncharacterized protein n=1 Tax=Mucilaginibacter pedocola TaxID=1792845 RepID=A0A1S9PFW4_9SPHI|nr:hypothetical protein [Mucilaginibacter pedocola]OOQ59830.1 hypothetical protein BC343_06705 [Mucilaginibacter pedocola]
MQEKKPIVFDYRLENEVNQEPFQLVISRTEGPVDNELLFLSLYERLRAEILPGREQMYYNDLSRVLHHHYWKNETKFVFVNELAGAYHKARKAGLLNDARVNDFLEDWLSERETNSAIYEGTIRLSAVADEQTALRMEVPVGTPYTYIPEPQSDREAFLRLKFMMGPQVCEFLIREFNRKYQEPTAEVYVSELAPLKKFTEHADYGLIISAFERHDNDHEREYLRILHGYYENHRCEQHIGNTAALVYGKYILYQEWLEKQLRESFTENKPRGLPQLDPGKVSADFTLGQELFDRIYRRNLLADFFLVPAPPASGRFWYDINDRETDDPAKVVRVSPLSIPQRRRATKSDFVLVHDQVNIIRDIKSKAYRHFIDDLITCLQQMIGFHRDLSKPEERKEDHYKLLELAEDFIKWLKAGPKLTANPSKSGTKGEALSGPEVKMEETPQPVIALACYYKNEKIDRANSREIIQRYNPGQSGDKLYHHYIFYSDHANRVSPGDTKTITKNKLERLLKVVELLADHPSGFAHAKRDLEEFKRRAGID